MVASGIANNQTVTRSQGAPRGRGEQPERNRDDYSAYNNRLAPLLAHCNYVPDITPSAFAQAKAMVEPRDAAYLDSPLAQAARRDKLWDELKQQPAKLEGALLASLAAYRALCPFTARLEMRPELLPSATLAIAVIKDPNMSKTTRELALITQFFRSHTREDLQALARCLHEVNTSGPQDTAMDAGLQVIFAKRFSIPLPHALQQR